MALGRHEHSSDQKILARTKRYPSPDHEGATRCEVETDYGEVLLMDFEKMDYNAATGWCGYVRETVNARYDHEARAEEQRARRAQTSGAEEESGAGDDAAGNELIVPASVQAPEKTVDADASPAETFASQRDGLAAEYARLNTVITDAQKKRATLAKQIAALDAALEVLNGDNESDVSADGRDVPDSTEDGASATGSVGEADEGDAQ